MSETKKSGFGTAALVVGIVGICLSFFPIINNAAFILGILAVVFAIVTLAKQASKGKGIAALVLGVLAIVITVVMQQSMLKALDAVSDNLDEILGTDTEELLQNSVDVTFGEFVAEEDGFLTDTKVTVNVKNKTSETKSFVIQIEAVDSNGTRIDTDYIYANTLAAGQDQNFDAFTLVSSDHIEALRNAVFKVVEVSMY